ncbi:MAG TPA: glycerophosphodiester phosphodiesterase [Solirubrobacterales bacterium]|nr:glycerophosphodiester phosphodiesterase [Solirubrobacterales bacterium]
MAEKPTGGPGGAAGQAPRYRRVGHKGADAIITGNTPESFDAAVEQGVDMVELDVLRDKTGRLIVAHDYHDALIRKPMDLTEALDLFLEPPLDEVEIDCDLKLPGREAELAGALAGRGLLDRAMISTQEIESLMKLRQLEPDLRLGWTYPKTKRDWTQYGWAQPALKAGISALRRRYPSVLAKRGPGLGVSAAWVYHPIITPRAIEVANELGIEMIAWTVDDAARIRELIEMGVDGVCTNDPRLFGVAERELEPVAAE